jgi:hypothetical protein
MRGVVHLPFSVLFSEDALGGSLRGATDRAVFTLHLPRLPADADETGFFLEPPRKESWPFSTSVGAGEWGHLGFDGRRDNRRISLASWVRSVAIEIETDDEEDCEPWQAAAIFGPKFNAWYGNWVEWVGIWTELHSAVDSGLAIETRGQVEVEPSGSNGLTGWSPGATLHIFPPQHAATRAIAEASARRASTSEPPPLEWRLWNSARVLQDNRRALIDAATASEVALAGAVRKRLNSIPQDALEAIVNAANGLVGLLKLVEVIDGLPTKRSRSGRVVGKLAKPRNSCVHRGIEPTRREVQAAIREAQTLLEIYSPRPELN